MNAADICGQIEVKYSHLARKFGHWKVWRKNWCKARRAAGNTVELEIGYGTSSQMMVIPSTSILARVRSKTREYAFGIYVGSTSRSAMIFLSGYSETETQKWMGVLRAMLNPPVLEAGENEFLVSVIDRHQRKFSNDRGNYGILKLGPSSLALTDQATGNLKADWKWGQILSCHLKKCKNSEDQNKIIIIKTTGELLMESERQQEMFCPSAPELHRMLDFRIRPRLLKRLLSSPLPPAPPLQARRSLSRSEGNLSATAPTDNPHLPPDSTETTSTLSVHGMGNTQGAQRSRYKPEEKNLIPRKPARQTSVSSGDSAIYEEISEFPHEVTPLRESSHEKSLEPEYVPMLVKKQPHYVPMADLPSDRANATPPVK